jgi:hypothetical protein
VLRERRTERAFTSPLNGEKRPGTFVCAGCRQLLFTSDTKHESGTGWPSFYQPLEGAVGTTIDPSWFAVRTEVHWARWLSAGNGGQCPTALPATVASDVKGVFSHAAIGLRPIASRGESHPALGSLPHTSIHGWSVPMNPFHGGITIVTLPAARAMQAKRMWGVPSASSR